MSESKKKKIIKKAPSPYPVAGELVLGGAKVVLEIVRLSKKGLVANVRSGICQVGVHYQCQFTLPGGRGPMQLKAQVFKTTDGLDAKTRAVQRKVEVLFVGLGEPQRLKIGEFLSVNGQKE